MDSNRSAMLPISSYRDEILKCVRENKVTIIFGGTGCGKSTQVTKYIYEEYLKDTHDNSMLVVTQPRRVAVLTLCKRVNHELGFNDKDLGKEVGYSIRFDEKVTKCVTKVQFMTDGMLLKKYSRHSKKRYRFIILDEVHERNVNTDLLLSILKNDMIMETGPEKLIIMSATLESQKLLNYFRFQTLSKSWVSPKIIQVQGKVFPRRIFHTTSDIDNLIESIVITIFQIHLNSDIKNGNILVFLPGSDDIVKTTNLLRHELDIYENYLKANDLNKDFSKESMEILPFFSALSKSQQNRAVNRDVKKGVRKIILSTNIAETSLTILNIKFIIDTGLMKIKYFDPDRALESLVTVPISKSSAEQRAGRVGRLGMGYCYRLYTEKIYHMLTANPIPEIRRVSLNYTLLLLLKNGLRNIFEFDFIDKPDKKQLIRSIQELMVLKAIEKLNPNEFGLTKLGLLISEFPIDPRLSLTLIYSFKHHCIGELVATIISLLSVQNLFYLEEELDKSPFSDIISIFGDHLTLLNLFIYYKHLDSNKIPDFFTNYGINKRAFEESIKIKNQIVSTYYRHAKTDIQSQIKIEDVQTIDNMTSENILKCFLISHKNQILKTATKSDKGNSIQFKTIMSENIVKIHPTSFCIPNRVPNEFFIYHESIITSSHFVKGVSKIYPIWLKDLENKPMFQ